MEPTGQLQDWLGLGLPGPTALSKVKPLVRTGLLTRVTWAWVSLVLTL